MQSALLYSRTVFRFFTKGKSSTSLAAAFPTTERTCGPLGTTTSTLYPFITRVNAIRKQAIAADSTYVTYKANPIYSDSKTIVMRKSQVVSTYTNVGPSGSTYSVSLPSSATGFTPGQAITELMSCSSFTTDSSGTLAITISGGAPLVFHPSSSLGSGSICSTA